MFEADPDRLAGVVLYQANSLSFFPEKTVIDPSTLVPIHHSRFAQHSGSAFKIVGKMPDDFHGKLVAAINASIVLEPKTKKRILGYINES